ncbi:thiamine pyrophosphate-binding protein [Chondromyces apiculatus]|uniref:Acetolactate synthase large subunit n=1 Tax=Chondromyces apiculatus DSM 436 TaxID=1192034 RepID=A0A017SXQ9_9BACT|nr:thiamine pyrophosphate-binding protein [Chondromyces apiculatus]EYF01784.1 Acetolactate synthase large subunit [Chondromyces apiculatus DSM 436]
MAGAYGATVVEILLDRLEAEGVEYIFGVPGASLTPIYEALLERTAIKQILAKHEEGAALMAAGYARVSGKIGVCCATTGPGGTNALTGVASAYADSVPLLMVTGQASTQFFGKGAFQESSSQGIDIVQIFRPVTKLSVMLHNAERFPALLHEALRVARIGRPGPVHLNIPADFMKEFVASTRIPPVHLRPLSRPADRASVIEAVKVLSEAERPAILAGHGVTISQAAEPLRQLAERLQIPVATTPKAKGVFPEDHPLSLGVFGFAGHSHAEKYLLQTNIDTLLVIGTSMGEWSTNAWSSRLQPTRALIQVDLDAAIIGRNYHVEIGVVGDAAEVLTMMAEDIEALSQHRGERKMNTEAVESVRMSTPRFLNEEPDEDDSAPVKPQHLIREMQRAMPEDALFFVDIGNAMSWAGHYFQVRRPNSYFVAMGLAAMGSGLAGAIGGKLAAPGQAVVALVGDSAFAMNGMEVHTAVEHDVPVIWIVLNDGGHAMIMHGESLLLGKHLEACRFRVPLQIAALGAALGARTFRVETRSAFRAAFEEALAAGKPCVIDVLIDPREVPQTLSRRVRTLAASFDHVPLSMRSRR